MKTLFQIGALSTLPLILGCTVIDFGATQNSVEGGFQEVLEVPGPANLNVSTGAGRVTVQPGDSGRIAITANIRVSERGRSHREAEELVATLQANPPIEQTGSTIRIGDLAAYGNPRNVAISYQIEAPAQTALHSRTGSGSQEIDGVSGPLDVSAGSGGLAISNIQSEIQAQTGSGSIRLTNIGAGVSARTGSGGIVADGVGGAFRGQTGSGSVRLTQTATGDVEVSTGSGSIELHNVSGALVAHTGSGGISVDGELVDNWDLDAQSGSVTLRLPRDAGFDLEASTRSGSISVDHPVVVRGRVQRNEMSGTVRGGGPLLHVKTGSGSIRVE